MNRIEADAKALKAMTDTLKCNCGYCRSGGMSKSAEECVEKMAIVNKRLKESMRTNQREHNNSGG